MLNHDSDEIAELAVSVLSYWLGRGASAWRLDAAYAVPPSFWARVLPRVRSEFPDAWFVGEVIHGDYRGIVERSSMDSLTQYELWKAIWSCLLDENFFELDWCLNRHNAFLDAFVPLTFRRESRRHPPRQPHRRRQGRARRHDPADRRGRPRHLLRR